MAKTPSPIAWASRQQAEDCDHAAEYLALLLPARAAKALGTAFRRASVDTHLAKNIVRAARVTPLPRTNKKVKEDLRKIARGKALPPILLVRGDAARAHNARMRCILWEKNKDHIMYDRVNEWWGMPALAACRWREAIDRRNFFVRRELVRPSFSAVPPCAVRGCVAGSSPPP